MGGFSPALCDLPSALLFVLRFRRFFEGEIRTSMPDLGKKYTCYSCHTKFYDLGKPVPLCPKCGADQRDADEAPAYTAPRGRARVVEEPAEEEDFTPAASSTEPAEGEEGEDFAPADDDREEEADEEEEEY
jgi:hypothetical protein